MLLNTPLQKSFNNISQRLLSGLMISFSDFKPIKSDVSEKAQKDFYDILKRILLSLYNNPEKMGLPNSEDDYLQAFTCGNSRPEFDKFYKKVITQINDFYKILYFTGNIGKMEENRLIIGINSLRESKIKIKKEYIDFITSVGILASMTKEYITFEANNDLLRAWRLLAKTTLHTDIYDKSHGINSVSFGLLKFACALYSDDFSYYQNAVEVLHNLPRGYFTPYIEHLKSQGFYEETFGDLFGVEYKIKGEISGFAIRFHCIRDEQFYFMAENSQGVKAMLADYVNVPAPIQDYLVFSCGKCSGCMGCTKGGKSAVYTMKINHKGQKVALCPQFNRREWFASDINDQFMTNLIEYIKLQEKYGKSK
jgi:hypothetical protein